jgi:hypothetical protein
MTTTQLSCSNCQHHASGDGFIDERVTENQQWEFEEPSPSPVTGCELFEFAIADEYVEEIIDLDEF